MSLEIGITGNIGSGKTIISRLFQLLGIPVYNADDESKKLLEKDPDVISRVKKVFGDEIYLENGEPNRKLMASIVFNDKLKLKELENILHPAVRAHYRKWALHQSSPYILKEAALLFESGSYQDLNKIIVVSAPEYLRIQRVIKRDNLPDRNVVERIRNQLKEEEKIAMADFIIINDDVTPVLPQIIRLHSVLLSLSLPKP